MGDENNLRGGTKSTSDFTAGKNKHVVGHANVEQHNPGTSASSGRVSEGNSSNRHDEATQQNDPPSSSGSDNKERTGNGNGNGNGGRPAMHSALSAPILGYFEEDTKSPTHSAAIILSSSA